MRVLTVVGARPQFIKAAPVSAALKRLGVEEIIVHTGQHYDLSMSQVFFDELKLKSPDINLNIGSGSHGIQTGAMLAALDPVMNSAKPDCVLIYGDTNSTLAGALAAAKLRIPIAHVEAGLRSFNRAMPEEINRVVADSVSDLLLAPTATAVRNLLAEGVPGERILQTGDVMYDAALIYGELADRGGILARLGLLPQQYALATVHRAENTDNVARLAAIAAGLAAASASLRVIWPVHPRTRKALVSVAPELRLPSKVVLTGPLGYLDMLQLERNAAVIVTDSGGVQKEAFFCQVPCVTLRNETEWTELITLSWNMLCPPLSGAEIAGAILSRRFQRGRPGMPYGDGPQAAVSRKPLLVLEESHPRRLLAHRFRDVHPSGFRRPSLEIRGDDGAPKAYRSSSVPLAGERWGGTRGRHAAHFSSCPLARRPAGLDCLASGAQAASTDFFRGSGALPRH
jgi:UDP-GlcNAc3NAcA epimerase